MLARTSAWWRRPWAAVAAAALAYLAVALVVLRPGALTDCGGSIFGDPGDPTGGWIWHQWNLDALGLGPFAGSTPLAGYPEGTDLWQPHFATWAVLLIPLWTLTKLLGPVCAYNVEVLLGLVGSALAMFGLVRWLTRHTAVALVAGAVFAFSPYMQVKAAAHLPYVHVWVFPLLVWAVLALVRDPGRGRALAVGALVGGAAYVDGYYLLLVPPVAVAMLGLWVLAAARRPRDELRRRVTLTAGAALTTGVLLLPLGIALVTQSDAVNEVVRRDPHDLVIYSARPWEYVVPSVYHPAWSDVLGDWQRDHLHDSNFGEQTLYLGLPSLVGTGALGAWLVRRRRRTSEGESGHPLRVDPGTLLPLVGGAAVVALIMSFPPTVTVGGRALPTPSRAVASIAPLWRVLARFFIPLSAALVVLAAAGLALWLARARRPALVLAVLVPVFAFDSLSYDGLERWRYDGHTDRAYEWLADRRRPTPIAEYPIVEDIFHAHHQWYQTFQPTHRQPMLNGAPWGSDYGRLTAGLTGLADPQTIPALRRLGIDLVLVHAPHYQAPLDTSERPFGLEPVFAGDTVVVHRIAPGPLGSAVLGVDDDGWFRMENDDWTSRRWLSQDGEMRVFRLDGSGGEVCAGFDVASFAVPRALRIEQAGDVLWEGEVAFDHVPVSFVARTGAAILVSAAPGPVPVRDYLAGSDDARPVSVEISRLRASTTLTDCSPRAPSRPRS